MKYKQWTKIGTLSHGDKGSCRAVAAYLRAGRAAARTRGAARRRRTWRGRDRCVRATRRVRLTARRGRRAARPSNHQLALSPPEITTKLYSMIRQEV